MSAYRRGREAEYRARRLLAAAGYVVVRAAGSKGPIDLIAWNGTSILLVAVRRGARGLRPHERERLRRLPRPAGAEIELWHFPRRCRVPVVTHL